MPDETIVNHTPETFGQKLERERLEQAENEGLSPEHIEAFNRLRAYQDSENSIAQAGPAITEVLKNPDIISELEKLHLEVDRIEVLRVQVISAFKHLGLDTRKFFGV